MVGDGEAETGPLATAWHINKFLNPIRDGAVLPILHLNGYKINNPTISARDQPHEEIEALFRGYGWTPYFVEGSDPESDAPGDGRDDRALRRRHPRRPGGGPPTAASAFRPRWPMIVLRTPEGVDRPRARSDGHKLEGFWRSHQVPMADVTKNPAHLKQLEEWMRSYKPEELFDEAGRLIPELRDLPPTGAAADRRQPARQRRAARRSRCDMPDFRDYGVKVEQAGHGRGREPTKPLGEFLRDVDAGEHARTSGCSARTRTTSNQLNAVYEVSQEALAGESTSPRTPTAAELPPTAA